MPAHRMQQETGRCKQSRGSKWHLNIQTQKLKASRKIERAAHKQEKTVNWKNIIPHCKSQQYKRIIEQSDLEWTHKGPALKYEVSWPILKQPNLFSKGWFPEKPIIHFMHSSQMLPLRLQCNQMSLSEGQIFLQG